ncbi:MAG TPA: DUF5131 family protein, partial [Ramlibacter sp.]|nr:DUF5131 family protein [Ramlibacter sp.]
HALNDGCAEGAAARKGLWIIVGGESSQPGHPARRFEVSWARSTIKQCREAGVPVFVKQLGDQPFIALHDGFDPNAVKHAKKWDDPTEWPEWLRVQEFPVMDRSTTERR